MRCYGCGEVIRQIAIEDSLKSGRSLKETLDQLDYPLLCCRDLIRGQVSVLEIEKRKAAEARIQATSLTLASTAQPSTFSLGPGRSVSQLRVIDEAPPGTVETGIVFPSIEGGFGPIIGSEESFLQEGTSPGDAYQYFMMQAQGDLEGGDED
jgi:DNA-directed RNA polymerase subunit N (RpoN/RPB10)